MSRTKQTHVYKTVGQCEIRADVYPAPDVSRPSPVVVWIHGGALIMGSRRSAPDRHLERYLDAGLTVVSVDYRLAPETKVEGIVEDVRDAFRWVRETGPALFGIDPERVATVGHSAGGYLSLMSGRNVDPRPRCIASFYGYGDIVGDWYSKPSRFYLQEPPVTQEEARAAVGEKAVSEGTGGRRPFYLFCRQRGLWPRLVGGHDPASEPDALLPFCPARNVSADFPPTLLLHGDEDTDVPYEQSVMMSEALERAGVASELITIPGGGHGFDSDADEPVVAKALDRVVSFLAEHLR